MTETTRTGALSAALIVKNEERFLEDCLLSIRDHVDEIVVVDTGSTDRSCEIARRFGAKLVEREWPGNFAEARNWALDDATGDWILYIDADERFVVPSDVSLPALLEDKGAVAYTVRFQPKLKMTCYEEMRVFRNDPRIRFKGLIHEDLYWAVNAVCRSDGLAVKPSWLGIVHHGYEGDLTHKYHRNLPLLREAVQLVPGRVFYWHDLGNALAGTGEIDEALAMYHKAITIGLSSSDPKQRADTSGAYGAAAFVMLADDRDALELVEEGLRHFPANVTLQFASARALIRGGRPQEALPVLERLAAIDPDGVYDPLMAYDRRIFGEYAHDAMGIAYLRLQRFADAATSYEKAAALAPMERSYRMKAAAARAQSRPSAGKN